jgi:hypothetical protein
MILEIGDGRMHGACRADPHVACPRVGQHGEDLVHRGLTVEEIEPPLREDLRAPRLAVHDVSRRGQLLQQVPEIEEFVDCRAKRRGVERLTRNRARSSGAPSDSSTTRRSGRCSRMATASASSRSQTTGLTLGIAPCRIVCSAAPCSS